MRTSDRDAGGYTLFELLIVMSIMVLLMAISIPAVLSAIGAMQGSTSRVTAVHDQAMTLAMAGYAPTDNRHFGVVLTQAAGQRALVKLIYALPGAASYADAELVNSAGKAIASYALPPDLEIWCGDDRLMDLTPTEKAWFYQYRTGCPISTVGPGRIPANIGLAAASTTDLFGLTTSATSKVCGGVTYACGALSTPALAPPSATNPGLSLRRGQLRAAIAIYSSGVIHVSEF